MPIIISVITIIFSIIIVIMILAIYGETVLALILDTPSKTCYFKIP